MAADFYNSLPEGSIKQQFKQDFDANLAKASLFPSMKAASEFTNQEFASRAHEQNTEVVMAK